MSSINFVVRRMARDELDLAVRWAAEEGWNPGLHDSEAFYAGDPEGFFLGEADGRPAGCVSAVSYGEGYGFIGLFIVKPEFRGRGFGMRLWKAAMAHLKGRIIGLDGVTAQQANYQKSGFETAHRNIRFEGQLDGGRSPYVIPLTPELWDKVIEFDRQCFPAPREAFLRAWLSMPNAAGYVKMERGIPRGYGVTRTCGTGCKIGPLFADDGETAESIFRSLAEHARGGPVFLDVPENNANAMALAARHNMRRVFETARMYAGGEPEFDCGKVYGITTFELG